MDREPQAAHHGGSDLGRYEVLGRLAVGGMAELFLARPRDSAQIVVIKRILPQLAEDPEFVRMFRDEAHLAATLHHPNIARVFDIGTDGDEPFFAMEYIHGENLRTILRGAIAKGEPIPLSLVLTIADGLCAALHHAHEQNDAGGRPLRIVHRDVSPTNVLVSQRGEVKIVDFGIAKAAAATHVTQAGMLKGKASYMSPEQCRAEGVDRRSDIFAIGILLFELTTLQRLFKGENELAILHQILTGHITRPSSVTMNYPAELEAILLRTLQIDPNHRYLTAAALRDDLRAFAQRYNLPLASEPLARYLVDRFGAKPYPRSEVPTPTADESSSSVPRAEPAAPANVRPVPRAPTGASAAANRPGAGQLKPAPRPRPATPGIIARPTGPSPAAPRGPIAARPSEARPSASTSAASRPTAAASAPPESASVPVAIVDDPSMPTTARPVSAAPMGAASSSTRPSLPTQPSITRPSTTSTTASPRPSGPMPSGPTSSGPAPSGPTQPTVTRPAGPRPSGPTQPSPARPLAVTSPPAARPPSTSRTVAPDPSHGAPRLDPSHGAPPGPPSAADSAAFLRGEPPPGAVFTAGAPEVRSGGTQIAIPSDGAPMPTPADPGVLGGTITLPGVPSNVDRTMIAMETRAPMDRTRLADSMPQGLGDPTVQIDVGPPRRAPDPTVMLPSHEPLARPPGPADRTMISMPDDSRPAGPRAPAQEAWPAAPRSGSTQPVAIDPSASRLAPAIAPRKGSSVGLVVALVAVVLVGVLGVGGFFAYPRVRAWIASRSETPAEPAVDASDPETPAADATPTDDAPAPEAEDDEPPPDAKLDDAPPPDAKLDDAPPPDAKLDDAPPPDAKLDDAPPPDAKLDDAPPPDAKLDDSPPDTKPDTTPDTKPDVKPDTKPDVKPDTKPDVKPDTKSTDPTKGKKKKKKKGNTPHDPTVPDFKQGPFVPP